MKRFLQFVGELLQAIELAIWLLAALALVAVGPFVWIYKLLQRNSFVVAGIVGILWLGSIVVVTRELRRGLFTEVSLGVLLAWLVALVFVYGMWF